MVAEHDNPAPGAAQDTGGLAPHLADTFFRTCADGLMLTDADGRLLAVNPAFCTMTGYTEEEAIGRKPGELLGSPHTPADFYREVFATIAEQGWWRGEITNRLKDGSLAIHTETIAQVLDEAGRVSHYVSTLVDVSELHTARVLAQQEHAITTSVLNSLPGIFFLLDREGRNWRCNGGARDYIGRPREWCSNPPQNTHELFDPDWHAPVDEAIRQGFADGHAELEAEIRHSEGHATPFHFSAHRVDINGQDYLCGIGIDMTRHRDLENNLHRLATTDPLTGALNRRAMEERLHDELARCTRYDCGFSLVMADIDLFKTINDHHGHDVGDHILEQVVANLNDGLRRNDALARWGGEEFLILLAETGDDGGLEATERMRARLRDTLRDPDGHPITVSFGLTTARAGDDLDGLLKRADDALYRAKADGRDRICLSPRPDA